MAKGNIKGNILNPTGKGGFKDNPQSGLKVYNENAMI